MSHNPVQRQFTGKHMLAIMIAFFSVIIGVNVTMATFANKSWTGLVVSNTYIASQQFNERIAEGRQQKALGWQADLAISDGWIKYSLKDNIGNPVNASAVRLKVQRPTSDLYDQQAALTKRGNGEFSAQIRLADGIWIVQIEADTGLEHPYRDTRRVKITNGELR